MKLTCWWRHTPVDPAASPEADQMLREADALARRLKRHRLENHFGEKFHAALKLENPR